MVSPKIGIIFDSKFFKPNVSESVEADLQHLLPDIEDYENITWQSNAGKRAVVGVAEDVTRGRFTSKKSGDPALVPFFEEFYPEIVKELIQMRMTGLGFAIATYEGDTIDDMAMPIVHIPGSKPIVWIVPETKNMFQGTNLKSPPQLRVLDWSDEWKWWNKPVHKSRIEVLQFYSSEDSVFGHAELEASMIALWGIYNLEKGSLDRIAVWALLKFIFKVDPTTFTPTIKAKYDALATAMGQSNWYAVNNKDEVLQLADTAGHGQELLDILYTIASTGLRIPVVMLKGAQEGGVTGSETNLTIYGQLITSIQALLTPFCRRILKRWYAVDIDDAEWNVDFFQSKKTRLENEILEQQLEQQKITTERMRSGEDMQMTREVFGNQQQKQNSPDDKNLEEKQSEERSKNE